MKTLIIYKREVLERTGFRKYPYRNVTQWVIYYGGKRRLANTALEVDNPMLRVQFNKYLETRSQAKFDALRKSLSKKYDNASIDLENLLNELNKELEKGVL